MLLKNKSEIGIKPFFWPEKVSSNLHTDILTKEVNKHNQQGVLWKGSLFKTINGPLLPRVKTQFQEQLFYLFPYTM